MDLDKMAVSMDNLLAAAQRNPDGTVTLRFLACDENGNAGVRDNFAYKEHDIYQHIVHALNGGTAVVPSAAPAITATSIPRIESPKMPAGVRRVTFVSSAAPLAADTSPANFLGWLVAFNTNGQVLAREAFLNALDTDAGFAMSYGGVVTPTADLENIKFIPPGGILTVDESADLTDLFVLPLATETTMNGTATLSISLGAPV